MNNLSSNNQQRLAAIDAITALEQISDYAIFLLDDTGTIMSWSQGGESLMGYVAEDVIGKRVSNFYPAEGRAKGDPFKGMMEARRHGHVNEEGWRLRKDGTRFWARVTTTALTYKDGKPAGFLKIVRDRTQYREQEALARQELIDLTIQNKDLENQLAAARERIAVLDAELHELRGERG